MNKIYHIWHADMGQIVNGGSVDDNEDNDYQGYLQACKIADRLVENGSRRAWVTDIDNFAAPELYEHIAG